MEMISCSRPKHEGWYYRRRQHGQPCRVTFRSLPHHADRFEKIRNANLIIGDGGIIIGLDQQSNHIGDIIDMHREYKKPTQMERKLVELSNIVREVRTDVRAVMERQDCLMAGLQIVNRNVNTAEVNAMSRYTDMLANVTQLKDRAEALEAVLQALADTPNDAQWKELNDKIIASSDQVQAAIDFGTPPVVPTEPPVIVEPPLPSGGGAGAFE